MNRNMAYWLAIRIPRMEDKMDMFGHVKNFVRELIDITLVLMALAVALSRLACIAC